MMHNLVLLLFVNTIVINAFITTKVSTLSKGITTINNLTLRVSSTEFILETSSPSQLKSLLFKIAAITNRGENSSENDKLEAEKYVSRLEEMNPTDNPVDLK